MHEWTVKDYAAREQVAPKTVRRWIERGAFEASEVRKTKGGHYRIQIGDAQTRPNGPKLTTTR